MGKATKDATEGKWISASFVAIDCVFGKECTSEGQKIQACKFLCSFFSSQLYFQLQGKNDSVGICTFIGAVIFPV